MGQAAEAVAPGREPWPSATLNGDPVAVSAQPIVIGPRFARATYTHSFASQTASRAEGSSPPDGSSATGCILKILGRVILWVIALEHVKDGRVRGNR